MSAHAPLRVLYLMHHPIHYQASLIRRLARVPGIALKVGYISDATVRGLRDEHGFGQRVTWDTPLLDGYEHQFIDAIGSPDRISVWQPLAYGVGDLLRDADVLWVHGYAQITLVWAIAAAVRRNIPVLLRGESSPVGVRRPLAKRLLKRAWLRWLLPRVESVLYIGTANKEHYRRHGVAELKLFFMPYAVDNAYFQAAAAHARARRGELHRRLGLDASRPVVLYTGKLTARKRATDLLDAYVRLSPDGRTEPDAYLLFAGDGELRPALEHRARDLGWRSIRLLGFQNQSELPALYDLCDLLVVPSFDEPWGMVVNEAMNAGRSVVVSDQVGAGFDLVKEGVNGWRYPAGDCEALARCLRDALGDRSRLARMGEASLARINRWSFNEDVAGFVAAVRAVRPAARHVGAA